MRICVIDDEKRPGDFDYKTMNHDHYVYVWLDGVFQPYVQMADEEAGVIIRDVVEDGKYVIQNDGWLRETLRGKVEIKVQPPDSELEKSFVRPLDVTFRGEQRAAD